MKSKSLGFKIGVILAAIHFSLVLFAYVAYVRSSSSTGGLVFLWFFVLDAPLLLLPTSLIQGMGPLIQYGVLGSAMWFLMPWLIDRALGVFVSKGNRWGRIILILGAISCILIGFKWLGPVAIKQKTVEQRPAELKASLNQASTAFLKEKSIVLEKDEWTSINGLNWMRCRADAGPELIVTMTDRILFLDEFYQEQHRLTFESGFNRIEPVCLDKQWDFRFLAYRFGQGLRLFDGGGEELWSFTELDGLGMGIHPDGATWGDVDRDGALEYAIYYRYREGIHLVDSAGQLRWKHPVVALGHLEMADLDGDGKVEIIYDNANNANGMTEFVILDEAGQTVEQIRIETKSSEFALTNWQSHDSTPHILLTEENVIRLVDFQGETVLRLDAPGCRSFGEVNAVVVQFEKETLSCLAVRKSLHPDLMVLYVYDHTGQLMYQKNEVIKGGRSPTLAVIPVGRGGEEKLLSASIQERQAVIFEYVKP